LDFIRPSAGSGSIFGLDTVRDSVTIRSRIGYLPSELKLWENWTGAEYLRWLDTVRGAQDSAMDEASRLAERLDYELKRSLAGMSTGMKRKMGLIAALAHKPELLILDEPTTGLDPLMQNVFHGLMREVRAEGRTVFLSSHNLPEVEAICDRVGIIRSGRLEAVESVADLTHVTFRWLTLTLASPATADGFSEIDGVTDLSAEGHELRMRISGHTNIDAVIKQAAQLTIKDILAYYGKREEV
jgi:ABC-2 type transport system ATP-binding protein